MDMPLPNDDITQRSGKAVVFSGWGRMLGIVSQALANNSIDHVSMVGGTPDVRSVALNRFMTDPTCRVLLLLMSNSSGAAGML